MSVQRVSQQQDRALTVGAYCSATMISNGIVIIVIIIFMIWREEKPPKWVYSKEYNPLYKCKQYSWHWQSLLSDCSSCFVFGRFWVQISTRRPAILTWDLRSFYRSVQTNSGTVPSIRTQPLPSIPFTIQESLIILHPTAYNLSL
jgi:hypothetical protein